jgi:hypothetical protein
VQPRIRKALDLPRRWHGQALPRHEYGAAKDELRVAPGGETLEEEVQRLRREIQAAKDYQITNVLDSQTVGHAA